MARPIPLVWAYVVPVLTTVELEVVAVSPVSFEAPASAEASAAFCRITQL